MVTSKESWSVYTKPPPCPRSEPGATHLQEISDPDSLSSPLRAFRTEHHFTLLRHPNEIFNAIKDQPWIRHSKSIWHDPTFLGAKEYFSFHDSKGHQIAHYRSLQWYLKEFVCQGFLKEYILTLGAASGSGQLSATSYPVTICNHSVQSDRVNQFHLQGQWSTSTNKTPCISFKAHVFYLIK